VGRGVRVRGKYFIEEENIIYLKIASTF